MKAGVWREQLWRVVRNLCPTAVYQKRIEVADIVHNNREIYPMNTADNGMAKARQKFVAHGGCSAAAMPFV
jgi:hypothetical protein